MIRITSRVFSWVVVAGSVLASGQQAPVAPDPSAPLRIAVNAPFAEELIVKIKAAHPEIQKLGLHAVPPGQKESAIIASNFPDKIGKISTVSDLQTVASGQPRARRINEGKFWDTFVPIHDRTGATIGFLVMEVPFSTAVTEDQAVAKGIEVRNQVEQKVPTLEKLFSDGEQ